MTTVIGKLSENFSKNNSKSLKILLLTIFGRWISTNMMKPSKILESNPNKKEK